MDGDMRQLLGLTFTALFIAAPTPGANACPESGRIVVFLTPVYSTSSGPSRLVVEQALMPAVIIANNIICHSFIGSDLFAEVVELTVFVF